MTVVFLANAFVPLLGGIYIYIYGMSGPIVFVLKCPRLFTHRFLFFCHYIHFLHSHFFSSSLLFVFSLALISFLPHCCLFSPSLSFLFFLTVVYILPHSHFFSSSLLFVFSLTLISFLPHCLFSPPLSFLFFCHSHFFSSVTLISFLLSLSFLFFCHSHLFSSVTLISFVTLIYFLLSLISFLPHCSLFSPSPSFLFFPIFLCFAPHRHLFLSSPFVLFPTFIHFLPHHHFLSPSPSLNFFPIFICFDYHPYSFSSRVTFLFITFSLNLSCSIPRLCPLISLTDCSIYTPYRSTGHPLITVGLHTERGVGDFWLTHTVSSSSHTPTTRHYQLIMMKIFSTMSRHRSPSNETQALKLVPMNDFSVIVHLEDIPI